MKAKLLVCILLCSLSALAQTPVGKCSQSSSNAGATCHVDSDCTGASAQCNVINYVFVFTQDNHAYTTYFNNFTSPGGCFPDTTCSNNSTVSFPCTSSTNCQSGTTYCPLSAGPECTTGTSCVPGIGDPTKAGTDNGHNHSQFLIGYNSGANNGFNKVGQSNQWMCTYNMETYVSWATHYGLANHFFPGVTGGPFPNHEYLMMGQSNGLVDTPTSATKGDGFCQLQNTLSSCASNQHLGDAYCRQTLSTDHCQAPEVAGCNAFHQGHCSPSATSQLCRTNTDCTTGGDTCKVDQKTGKYNYYSVSSPINAIDCIGPSCGCPGPNCGSGAAYHPGVCSNNNTINCTTLTCGQDAVTCAANACGTGNTCDTSHFLSDSKGSPCASANSIFSLLDQAGVKWAVYAPPNSDLRNGLNGVQNIRYDSSKWEPNGNTGTYGYIAIADFTTSPAPSFTTAVNSCTATSCSLAHVIYLNSHSYSEDANTVIANGQTWVSNYVQAIMSNSFLWKHSAIFVLWSNWGGYYDPVVPTVTTAQNSYMFRTPLILVSPYALNRITTTTFTGDSILSAIEHNFQLGTNLGLGDQTANNPLDPNSSDSMITFGSGVPLAAGDLR